ncbi:hypothetical protein CHS0354_039302, partial [Potamilus streckersoni]
MCRVDKVELRTKPWLRTTKKNGNAAPDALKQSSTKSQLPKETTGSDFATLDRRRRKQGGNMIYDAP